MIPSLGRFDDDDYDDLVEQSVDDLGASVRSSDRRDFLPDGVRHFHAYTQICRTAKFGFATKEQGIAFVNSGKASAMLSEFVAIIGSKTTARASDGGMLTVQRDPKGGFFRLMFANLTEHDLRIVAGPSLGLHLRTRYRRAFSTTMALAVSYAKAACPPRL